MCRDIIPNESQWFVSGCGHYESADHLFIHCPIFEALLQHVKVCRGLMRIQWIPNILWIILPGLLTLQVALNLVGLFCNLYGFALFGCYGMKGIIDFSPIRLNLLCISG